MGKNYHKFMLPGTVLSTVRYWHINAAANIMKGIKYDSVQSLGGHLYAETWSVQSICWAVFQLLRNDSSPSCYSDTQHILLLVFTHEQLEWHWHLWACPETNLVCPLGLSLLSLSRGFQLCYLPPNSPIHSLSISQIDWAAAPQTEFTHIHKSSQYSRRLLGILRRRWNSTVWPVCSQSFWTGTLWNCSVLQH